MVKIDIEQFLGKPKEYVICGQTVLLEPLKGKDIDLLFNTKDDEHVVARKVIMRYFELTEEQFNTLSLEFINAATKAIMDVNGI